MLHAWRVVTGALAGVALLAGIGLCIYGLRAASEAVGAVAGVGVVVGLAGAVGGIFASVLLGLAASSTGGWWAPIVVAIASGVVALVGLMASWTFVTIAGTAYALFSLAAVRTARQLRTG